ISGKSGGSGWAGAWDSGGPNAVTVVSGAGSINYNNKGIVRGGGNAVKLSQNVDRILSRSVFDEVNKDGSDYYTSFIFQIDAVDGRTGNAVGAFLSVGANDGRNYSVQTLGGINN